MANNNEGLIKFTSPDELMREKEAERSATAATKAGHTQEERMSMLAGYIRTAWDKARIAKQSVEPKMMRNLRMFKSEYDPAKLAAIKQMEGSEVYIPLVNIKCRAGMAWIEDILFQPDDSPPWSVKPTPIPEIPEERRQEIITELQTAYQAAVQQISLQYSATGQVPDDRLVHDQLMAFAKELKKKYDREIEEYAKEKSEKVSKLLEDQFVEGGFYNALRESVHTLMIFQSAIIEGPIYRRDRRIKIEKGMPIIEDVIIPTYRNLNPLDVYPAPDSSGINDGYLIIKESITPKELHSLIGVEGYNEKEIRAVLKDMEAGQLKEWTNIDQERRAAEDKNLASMFDTDKADMLRFNGDVKGDVLIDWGVPKDQIPDPDGYYPTIAWLVGTHVIKALLNPDITGKQPYAKASFIEVPGSFWGMSPADLLEELQIACNAMGRAIVNNAAIASGPLVERNKDRIPAYESKKIFPWKIFDSTDIQMSGSPAYKFYTPPFISDKLLLVLQNFMKQSDEVSGIPAYAHGDVTVGGAGRTASGFQMLSNNSNRGIKSVVRNIDRGIIEDIVSRQFYIDLAQGLFGEDVPDVKIFARGSVALAEKELQSIRRNEFLTATTNPFDIQVLGVEGRKYLLSEVAKSHGIDPDELFDTSNQHPPMPDLMGGQPPQGAPGQIPMGGTGGQPTGVPGSMLQQSQMSNGAGNSVNGQEVRMMNGENG